MLSELGRAWFHSRGWAEILWQQICLGHQNDQPRAALQEDGSGLQKAWEGHENSGGAAPAQGLGPAVE